MKQILITCLLVFPLLHTVAMPKSIKTLLASDGTSISNIEYKEASTDVTFVIKGNPGDSIEFPKKLCIIDDQGEKHFVLERSLGKLGKKYKCGVDGFASVEVSFNPLQRRSRGFDVISRNDGMSDFFLIDVCGKEYRKARRLNRSPLQLKDSQGKVAIQGKVHGYDQDTAPRHISMMNRHPSRNQDSKAEILPDGTFNMTTSLETTIWSEIHWNSQLVPVLLFPDDTLHVDIYPLRDSYYEFQYSRKNGRAHENLMKADPTLTPFHVGYNWGNTPQDCINDINKCEKKIKKVCAYLAKKYGLSQGEYQMLQQSYKVQLYTQTLHFVNQIYLRAGDFEEKYKLTEEDRNKWILSEDAIRDYAFLRNLSISAPYTKSAPSYQWFKQEVANMYPLWFSQDDETLIRNILRNVFGKQNTDELVEYRKELRKFILNR